MQKNCKKFWFYQKTVVSLWRRSNVKFNLNAMIVGLWCFKIAGKLFLNFVPLGNGALKNKFLI